MKKRTTLLALGIILSSQVIPVVAHASSISSPKANLTHKTTLLDNNEETVEETHVDEEISTEEELSVNQPEFDLDEGVYLPNLVGEDNIVSSDISNIDTTANLSDEKLDDWMPDKNLQLYVARAYGVSLEEITKDLLQNSYVSIEIDPFCVRYRDEISEKVFPNGIGSLDLTGLEYSKDVSIDAIGLTDGAHFNTSALVGKDLEFSIHLDNEVLERYEPFAESPLITEFGIYDFDSFLSDNLLETNDNVNIVIFNFGEFQALRNKVEKTVTPDSYKQISISYSDVFKYTKNNEEIESYIECHGDEFYITNENGNKLIYTVEEGSDGKPLQLTLKSGTYEPGIYTSNGGQLPINADASLWEDEDIDLDNAYDSVIYTGVDYATNSNRLGVYCGSYLSLNLLAEGVVNVNYVDENDDNLAEPIVLSGLEGENYSTVEKSFDGYRLSDVRGNQAGTFNNSTQNVTYVYKKIESADVTVNYKDTAGKEILSPLILSGSIGEAYSTSPEEINGYTFKEVIGEKTGTFTEAEQTVTYVYTKNDSKSETNTKSSNHKNDGTSTSKEKSTLPNTGEQSSVVSMTLGGLMLLFAGGMALLGWRKINKESK